MILTLFVIAAITIVGSDALLGIGRTQSVAVQGRLICNGQPASNVKVKLYDDDVLLDAKMDEKYTDANGIFRVSGSANEITTIDPKVNIYHRCNYNGICDQKLVINIPDNYVTSGGVSNNVYDIGTINLANNFAGQSWDCINKQ